MFFHEVLQKILQPLPSRPTAIAGKRTVEHTVMSAGIREG